MIRNMWFLIKDKITCNFYLDPSICWLKSNLAYWITWHNLTPFHKTLLCHLRYENTDKKTSINQSSKQLPQTIKFVRDTIVRHLARSITRTSYCYTISHGNNLPTVDYLLTLTSNRDRARPPDLMGSSSESVTWYHRAALLSSLLSWGGGGGRSVRSWSRVVCGIRPRGGRQRRRQERQRRRRRRCDDDEDDVPSREGAR